MNYVHYVLSIWSIYPVPQARLGEYHKPRWFDPVPSEEILALTASWREHAHFQKSLRGQTRFRWDYRDKIISDLAEAVGKRLGRKVIRSQTKMTDSMQSGDDTPLKNIWDEICVQVQGEQAEMWDDYLNTIQSRSHRKEAFIEAVLLSCRLRNHDLPCRGQLIAYSIFFAAMMSGSHCSIFS